MHHVPNFSYRSLEVLCRQQAAISITPGAREELERMAREYRLLADCLDRQSSDSDVETVAR